jgi:hypothetical protein
MRFLVAVVVAACTLLASTDAVVAGLDSVRGVRAVESDQLHKRLLRTHEDAVVDSYDADDEERSITAKAKEAYMNLKLDRYINKGLLPKEVSQKLKIGGQGAAHKNYKYLEKYKDLWVKMDQPVHVSPSYHAKKKEQLGYWFSQKFSTEGVLRQLHLAGLHGKALTSHKNYPYYIRYLDMLAAANRAA